MKKRWVSILTSLLFGFSAFATQIPIPSTPADSLEHFLEQHKDMYANGDTILLVDPSYVISGTADLYHGVTIMGDPGLSEPPMVQFLDNGFRLKQDSTSVYIKGLNLNGFNDDKSHRAKFILRMDNIPASDSIFYVMKIEDVEAVGFGGGMDLHQQKHAQYDSVIVNNVLWHDFSGEYCVDPNINFSGYLSITNSTFYDITHGFVKNPDFAQESNGFTKIPKTFVIDHNTIYNLGGSNNALIQINDPHDSTVTLSFTNNIVQKLYDPNNVRPFRISEEAGTFDFNTNVIYDFMPTNPDRMQYSFDSTVANQTNVTSTNLITDDPKLLDAGDFRLPLGSPLLTADTEGGQIGDQRWGVFEGVYIYEPKGIVFTNSTVDLDAAIAIPGGDTVLNWTVENDYDNSGGASGIVDSTGIISPTAAGMIKVTATSVDNGTYFDTLIVTIQDSVHVTGVTVRADGAPEITELEGDLDIIATISPADPTDPSVVWSIDDDNLAEFYVRTDSTIELVAKANGVVTVTVTTNDGGFSDEIEITITNQSPVEGVSVSVEGGGDALITSIGGTLQLIATIEPPDADVQTVSWVATPPSVASVTDGLVTAISEGTAKVVVTTDQGGFKDSIDVVVEVPINPGINDNSLDKLKVFPNPAYDVITLNVMQPVYITIHNILGDRLLEQNVEVGGSVNISELAKGVYFLNVSIGDQVRTLRFVKE